ncbi:hypothetical protein ACFSE0_10695 [Ochrobactrum teleogrylli]|uniref:Uncharacterized protein n=1 Tax=Ochrobactrum teleogrylli TaxID=2479765 RepID=A0ABY2Y8X4_9HYPH|nr:hypothetical protein [[Ochrobactrum] teleogrylli]TNV17763.1 hypothetical protein FIC94_06200 [[Ochrobactrum] teleogrylli]
MNRDPYEVSETLFQARRNVLQFEEKGRLFLPIDIRNLADFYMCLGHTAQILGHEVARLRQVDRVMQRHPIVTITIEEATRPGTNVVFLNRFGSPIKTQP